MEVHTVDQQPLLSITFAIDWWDVYMAAVSMLLLVSFRLAFKARATKDEQRSRWLMFASGALLAFGHSVFFVVGTALSLEGFYIANLGFFVLGTYTMMAMYRQIREAQRDDATAADVTGLVDVKADLALSAGPR
jgi:hypothetical protein